jgi:HSP20 family protein
MGLTARDYYTKDLIDEFFDNSYNKTACCKCDIYQKDGKYCIEIEMPGANKEDVVIDLEEGYLIVQYTQKNIGDYEDRKYIRHERKINSIERRFYVGHIPENSITAQLKNGILEICFPLENKTSFKRSIEIK